MRPRYIFSSAIVLTILMLDMGQSRADSTDDLLTAILQGDLALAANIIAISQDIVWERTFSANLFPRSYGPSNLLWALLLPQEFQEQDEIAPARLRLLKLVLQKAPALLEMVSPSTGLTPLGAAVLQSNYFYFGPPIPIYGNEQFVGNKTMGGRYWNNRIKLLLASGANPAQPISPREVNVLINGKNHSYRFLSNIEVLLNFRCYHALQSLLNAGLSPNISYRKGINGPQGKVVSITLAENVALLLMNVLPKLARKEIPFTVNGNSPADLIWLMNSLITKGAWSNEMGDKRVNFTLGTLLVHSILFSATLDSASLERRLPGPREMAIETFLKFFSSLASSASKRGIINVLLRRHTSSEFATYLDIANRYKLYPLMDILLAYDSDPYTRYPDGTSLLARAIVNADFSALALFAKHGIDFNEPFAGKSLRPLHFIPVAAEVSALDLEDLKNFLVFLMERGLDPSLESASAGHNLWNEFQRQINKQQQESPANSQLIELYTKIIAWKDSPEFRQLWEATAVQRTSMPADFYNNCVSEVKKLH